ncbi:MAG: hypothetical protein NTW32_22450 [Chloroflexi bacterium]|nr:hypothetical protein [Chloroflexota bacterium]
MANINTNLLNKLLKIRQSKATWQCTVRLAPFWITPKKQAAYRPFILLVVDQDSDIILKTEIITARPDTQAVLEQLYKTMQGSMFNLLQGQRPARISIDNAELAQACLPQLAELGIRCDYRGSLSELNTALVELETNMNQREPIPGLLSVPGASVPLVAELFAATAEFYRQAPWRWIENFVPIEVHYPADNERARYALVLGSGGEFYGISLYESMADLEMVFSNTPGKPISEPMTWTSIILEAATTMSFADLDAIERFGWPVAGDNAYPLAMKLISGTDESEVPSAPELSWLAAALRALPVFLVKHLHADRGLPQPAQAILPLPGIHSNQQIMLRYPAIGARTARSLFAQMQDPELEAFIDGWYWDEKTHDYARQVGEFLFEFLDDLDEYGLSDQTVVKHERNCWAIGWLEVRHGKHTTFSPDIFMGGPKFLQEYYQEISATQYSLSSYKTTWRKLEKYVISDAWQKPLTRPMW